jgi:hypothetical protein
MPTSICSFITNNHAAAAAAIYNPFDEDAVVTYFLVFRKQLSETERNAARDAAITYLLKNGMDAAAVKKRIRVRLSKVTRVQAALQRKLRFPRTDRVFTNLMNIACYAAMKRDEERRATRSGVKDYTIPYGVEDTASIRQKIENFRGRATGRGHYGGRMVDGVWVFTRAIETICEFDPTHEELDEAAAWYTAHPE